MCIKFGYYYRLDGDVYVIIIGNWVFCCFLFLVYIRGWKFFKRNILSFRVFFYGVLCKGLIIWELVVCKCGRNIVRDYFL